MSVTARSASCIVIGFRGRVNLLPEIISLFVQVDLKLKDENADLGTYVLNGEWHLLGKPRKNLYLYLPLE
jgi:hypothetical protein